MAITLAAAAITAARNAACDAIVGRLNLGSTAGRIDLTLEDAETVVASCIGQDPFFGAAVDGVATQNGNATDSAAAGSPSPVTKFQARDSNGVQHWDGTVGESGADLNIDDQKGATGTVIIDPSAVVTLSSITFTVSMA